MHARVVSGICQALVPLIHGRESASPTPQCVFFLGCSAEWRPVPLSEPCLHGVARLRSVAANSAMERGIEQHALSPRIVHSRARRRGRRSLSQDFAFWTGQGVAHRWPTLALRVSARELGGCARFVLRFSIISFVLCRPPRLSGSRDSLCAPMCGSPGKRLAHPPDSLGPAVNARGGCLRPAMLPAKEKQFPKALSSRDPNNKFNPRSV